MVAQGWRYLYHHFHQGLPRGGARGNQDHQDHQGLPRSPPSPRVAQGRSWRALVAKDQLARVLDGSQQVRAPLMCSRLNLAWVGCATKTTKLADPETNL